MRNVETRLVVLSLAALIANALRPCAAAGGTDAGRVSATATAEASASLSGHDVLNRFASKMGRLVDFHGAAEHRNDLSSMVVDLQKTLAEQGHQLAARPSDGRIFTGSQWNETGPRAKTYHLAVPNQELWVDIAVVPDADDLAQRWPTIRRGLPRPNSGSTGPKRALIYSLTDSGNSVAVAVFYNGNQIVSIGRRLSVAVPVNLDENKVLSSDDRQRIWRTLDKELSSVYEVTRTVVWRLVRDEDHAWFPPSVESSRLTADERVWGFVHLWYEVKYNFAFFDHVPELSWDRVRLRYLPLVKQEQSDEQYYRLLQRCLATLRDGHTQVFLNEPQDQPAIRVQMVDGRVIVTDVATSPESAETLLTPGLEITHLDGRSIAEVLAQEVYPYISASTHQDRDRRACGRLLTGRVGTSVMLTVRNADAVPREVTLLRVDRRRHPWFAGKRPLTEIRDVAEGIVYVALNSFESEQVVQQFDGMIDRIRPAKGLILDVRENGGGSSSHGYAIIGRLIREPLTGSVWKTRQYMPADRAWGKAEKWFTGEPSRVLPRGKDPYLGPVAVLIGSGTVSAAEDFLIPLHTGHRATLIGQKTAGTTGQPLMVDLPGGRKARICAKRDSYPDGTEFVGVGVIPDIEVNPTQKDIALGRDAVLEVAIKALQKQAASQPAPPP